MCGFSWILKSLIASVFISLIIVQSPKLHHPTNNLDHTFHHYARRSHISPCLWKISPCQNHVVDFTLFVVDFTLSCFTLFVVENTLFERSRKYLVWGRFYLVKYQKIGKMCQNVWVNWRECFALYCRRSPSFKNFRNSTNHWKSYFQHTHTIIWS